MSITRRGWLRLLATTAAVVAAWPVVRRLRRRPPATLWIGHH